MNGKIVVLTPFSDEDLPTVAPWFTDPQTRRFFGGPEWPARMLQLDRRGVGEEFRGAQEMGAFRI